MEGPCQYRHTKKALAELEGLLLCKICHMTLRDPCTLKSCQHIFCRACAEEYAGNMCPLCNVPSHMKDMAANRNMKNIVKLATYLNKLLYEGDQEEAMSECESVSLPDPGGEVPGGEVPGGEVPGGEVQDQGQEDAESDGTDDMEVDCQDEDVENKDTEPQPESKTNASKDVDPSSVYDFIPSPQTAVERKGRSVNKKKGEKSARSGGQTPGVSGSRSSRSKTNKEKKTKRLQDINQSWQVLSKCDSCVAKKGVRKTVRVVTPLSQEDARRKEAVDGEDVRCGDSSIEEEHTSHQEQTLQYRDVGEVDSRLGGCDRGDHHLAEPYVRVEKLDEADLSASGLTKINGTPGARHRVGACHDEERGDDRNAEASSSSDRKEKTPGSSNKRLAGDSHSLTAMKKSRKSGDKTENAATCPSQRGSSPVSKQGGTARQEEPSDLANVVPKSPGASGNTGRKSSGKERKCLSADRTSLETSLDSCTAAGSGFSTLVSSKKGGRRSTGGQRKLSSLESFVSVKSTSGELDPTTPSTGGAFSCPTSTGKASRTSAGSEQKVGMVTPSRKSSARLSRSSPASLLQKKNARGETPLHVAAIKGDVGRVQALLAEGANPNTKDNAGWTPLHEAANHGFTEIVRALLDHGAFINAPAMDNDSPLLDAVQNYRLETVRLLVSRGADLSLRNSSGQTPMDLAQNGDMREALSTPVDQVQAPLVLPSTPSSFTRPERVVLLCTGLKRPEQMKVQKCASMLHGRIVTEFSPEVSHVITGVNSEGMCARTLKYLNAVLLGKWILNFEWVESCLQYNERVCEEGFEVPGSSTHPESTTPWKGRQNAEKQLPGLFDGCKMYFSGSFRAPTPDKKELIQLAKNGGATVLHREPKLENVTPNDITVPYHARSGSYLADCCYFIIHDPKEYIKTQRHYRVCTAPASWLMECISKFELLDLPEGNAD